MDAVVHASAYVVSRYRVARFVRSAIDAQSTAAELQHFRHEDETPELPTFVQSREDLVFPAHLNQLSASEVEGAAISNTRFAQGANPPVFADADTIYVSRAQA
jgi:hypothetical protein